MPAVHTGLPAQPQVPKPARRNLLTPPACLTDCPPWTFNAPDPPDSRHLPIRISPTRDPARESFRNPSQKLAIESPKITKML